MFAFAAMTGGRETVGYCLLWVSNRGRPLIEALRSRNNQRQSIISGPGDCTLRQLQTITALAPIGEKVSKLEIAQGPTYRKVGR